jgi:hypothetical protein
MSNLTWDKIQTVAKSIFDIWIDSPELRWASNAWNILEKEGLTHYENDVEKQIIVVRLFVLGTLYHEFCHFAFDEYGEVDYNIWLGELFDELYLSPFRLGQLVGSGYRNDESITDEKENEQLTIETVESLIDQQRDIVVRALLNGFGSVSVLFASLWLSPNSSEKRNNDDDDDDNQAPLETLDDVLNYPTLKKMRAFEWVESGMPSIQTYQNYHPVENQCVQAKELIQSGETANVEFKIGLCYNPHTKKKDDSMITNVTKTVAAFINSNGGKLFIGVDDKTRQIIGVQNEYPLVNPQKSNRDGFELFLLSILRTRIDYGLIHLVCQIAICDIEKKEICEVTVSKSPSPLDFAYVDNKMYVRQHNRTVELTGKELVAHLRSQTIKAG